MYTLLLGFQLLAAAGVAPVPAGSAALLPSTSSTTHVLKREEVYAALRETLGGDLDNYSLELVEVSQAQVPSGKLEFPRTWAQLPSPAHQDRPFLWRGRVLTPQGGQILCWIKLTLTTHRRSVQLTTDVIGGQVLQANQMEVADTAVCPLFGNRDEKLADYDGLATKRTLRAHTALSRDLVQTPAVVHRGDRVQVLAVAGQAQISLEAQAHSDGRAGQSIELGNQVGGHPFWGVVTADGSVLVTVPNRNRTAYSQ